MRGFGLEKLTFGGTSPWRAMSAPLMRPVMRAEISRCPTLGLTEPIISGADRRRLPNTRPTAPASMGSPVGVPVPWHSTKPMWAGSTPPSAHNFSSMAICASCEGVVSVLVCPSWLTVVARMRTVDFCRHPRALFDSGFSTTASETFAADVAVGGGVEGVESLPVGESMLALEELE